jgi:hypothetical protein
MGCSRTSTSSSSSSSGKSSGREGSSKREHKDIEDTTGVGTQMQGYTALLPLLLLLFLLHVWERYIIDVTELLLLLADSYAGSREELSAVYLHLVSPAAAARCCMHVVAVGQLTPALPLQCCHLCCSYTCCS